MIIMFEMLLGHLVGDYLLQNNWMAFNKQKYNLTGWIICIIHCILYTLSVCILMNTWSLQWFILVFFSHFIIDKFGIAELYLQLIKGRSLVKFIKENKDYTSYGMIQSSFNGIVYTMTDNTMHLLLMYIGWKILFY